MSAKRRIALVLGVLLAVALTGASLWAWRARVRAREGFWLEDPAASSKLGTIQCLAFAPSGEWLVTVDASRAVCVWSIPERKLLRRELPPDVKRDYWIRSLAFTRNGRLVTGHEGASLALRAIPSLAASGDLDDGGDFLAGRAVAANEMLVARTAGSWEERHVDVWDVSASPVRVASVGSDYVTDVAFNRSGERLVTVAARGPTRVYETRTGKVVATIAGPQAASLAISPTSDVIATGAEQGFTVSLWSLEGRPLGQIVLPDGPATPEMNWRRVEQLSFSPDGRYLVATLRYFQVDSPSSHGPSYSFVALWNVERERLARTFVSAELLPPSSDDSEDYWRVLRPPSAHGVVFSPSGDILAIAIGHRVRVVPFDPD